MDLQHLSFFSNSACTSGTAVSVKNSFSNPFSDPSPPPPQKKKNNGKVIHKGMSSSSAFLVLRLIQNPDFPIERILKFS